MTLEFALVCFMCFQQNSSVLFVLLFEFKRQHNLREMSHFHFAGYLRKKLSNDIIHILHPSHATWALLLLLGLVCFLIELSFKGGAFVFSPSYWDITWCDLPEYQPAGNGSGSGQRPSICAQRDASSRSMPSAGILSISQKSNHRCFVSIKPVVNIDLQVAYYLGVLTQDSDQVSLAHSKLLVKLIFLCCRSS